MKNSYFTLISVLAAISFSLIAYTINMYAGVAVAVIFLYILFVYVFKFSGLTLSQKRKIRKHQKKTKRTDRYLFSALEAATAWDGESLSMFLEITPAPLQTLSFLDDGTGIPDIPVGIIAENLRRFDIEVDDMYITSFGFRTAGTTPHERAYLPATKMQMTNWSTVIEVSIRLETSMNEIDTRKGKEGTPEVGLTRTVNVASQRLMRELIDAGWRARVLTQTEVDRLDSKIYSYLGKDIFDHERKNLLGKDKQWAAVYASSTPHIIPSSFHPDIRTLGVIRHLRPSGERGADMDTYVVITGETKEAVTSHLPKKLKKMNGVQGDLLGYLLPKAPNIPIYNSKPTQHIANVKGMKISTGPAFGVGAMIGQTPEAAKNTSITIASGMDQVLYIATNPTFIRNLVTRMVAAGETVAVEIAGEDWIAWVNRVASPRLTINKISNPTIVLTASRAGEAIQPRAKVLTICITPQIPHDAKYYIEQLPDGILRAVTRQTYRDNKWTADVAEKNWR